MEAIPDLDPDPGIFNEIFTTLGADGWILIFNLDATAGNERPGSSCKLYDNIHMSGLGEVL